MMNSMFRMMIKIMILTMLGIITRKMSTTMLRELVRTMILTIQHRTMVNHLALVKTIIPTMVNHRALIKTIIPSWNFSVLKYRYPIQRFEMVNFFNLLKEECHMINNKKNKKYKHFY